MPEHTPEPWKREPVGPIGAASDIKTDYAAPFPKIATCFAHQHLYGTGYGNADRIVTCINALAGIEDPEGFLRSVRELVDEDGQIAFNVEELWAMATGGDISVHDLRQIAREFRSALDDLREHLPGGRRR